MKINVQADALRPLLRHPDIDVGVVFRDYSRQGSAPPSDTMHVYLVVREAGQSDFNHIVRLTDSVLFTVSDFTNRGYGKQIEILKKPELTVKS